MTMTDPIADMLTRLRNALQIKRKVVEIPHSRTKKNIAEVLKREGYILDFEVARDENDRFDVLKVTLKYDEDGVPAIRSLARESKPGRRQYRGVREMPRVLGGLGIAILSTSKGVMSDREAREARVGGEYMCSVY